jgi:hypothetical protein
LQTVQAVKREIKMRLMPKAIAGMYALATANAAAAVWFGPPAGISNPAKPHLIPANAGRPGLPSHIINHRL